MNNIVMNWKNQMISIVGKIEKKVGKYEWKVVQDGNDTVTVLKSLITPEALKAAKEMHIKMHKNNNQRGGYIKKYAKGGSVRKARY